MWYRAAKNVYKKLSITSVALLLALNSLAAATPLFLSKTASAEAQPPLTVATTCTNSGVLLTLQATNTLNEPALIWFNTNYGSSSEHSFPKDSTKTWTKNTNQAQIPAGTVSATTKHVVVDSTPPFIHVITNTYTADYAAFSCIPEAPTITTPGTYVSTTQPHATLSWTHPNPATITSYEYRQFTNEADANANVNPSNTITTSATSLTDSFSAVDATLYWRVTAKNSYGFTSQPSATVGTILVDRTAPQNVGVTTDKTLYGGGSNTITTTGSTNPAEPGATYSFSIADSNHVVKDSTTSASSVWNIPNVNNLVTYPSGLYTISLTVIDTAGNPSVTAATQVTIDNDGPVVTITPNNQTYKGVTVTPTVTATDPQGIDETSYLWVADKDNPEALTFGTTAKEPTFKPSEPGKYTFYLSVKDTLGNITEKAAFSFTWQSILPIGGSGAGTDTGSIIPTITNSDVPAGLAATQFNSTDPQVLGVTAEQAQQQTGDKEGKTKSSSTEKKEKEIVKPASEKFSWYWILLLIAVIAALYYAYRNWKLNKENNK